MIKGKKVLQVMLRLFFTTCILLCFSQIYAQTIFFEDYGQTTTRRISDYMPSGAFTFADPASSDEDALMIENGYYAVIDPTHIADDWPVPAYWFWTGDQPDGNTYGGAGNDETADHTGNTNGAVMVINGGTTKKYFYVRSVSLETGTCYRLSFYVYLVNASTQLAFEVRDVESEGVLSSSTYTQYLSEAEAGSWIEITYDFKIPSEECSVSDVQIALKNDWESESGNDYYVDDITLEEISDCSSATAITCPSGKISSSSTSTDSDGDGVSDDVDLDDDNDGILDTDECVSAGDEILNNLTAFGDANLKKLKSGNRLLKSDAINLGGTYYDAVVLITGTNLPITSESYKGGVVNTQGNSDLGLGTIYPIADPYVTYTLSFVEKGSATASNPSGTPVTLSNVWVRMNDLDGNGSTSYLADIGGYSTSNPPDKIEVGGNLSNTGFNNGGGPSGYSCYRAAVGAENTNEDATDYEDYTASFFFSSLSSIDLVFGVTGSLSTGTASRKQILALGAEMGCDTDNDGITDNLDLDSDGDGCSDANEAYGDWDADDNFDGADDGRYGDSSSLSVDAYGKVVDASYSYDSAYLANVTDAGTSVCQADLELTKEVDDYTPDAKQEVTFTLTLTNNGESSAKNIQVKDLLPDNLTYVSATVTKNSKEITTTTYDDETGIWNFVDVVVAKGETYILKIKATVGYDCGDIVNKTEIISSSQEDPDSTPGNEIN